MAASLKAAAVLVLAAASACAQGPVWQRTWTVHGFDCPQCNPADRAWLTARAGQTITLAPDRFTNPLYEDCTSGPDYTDIRPRGKTEVLDFLGPRRLPALVSARPLAGLVRCAQPVGPPNVVARLVIDGHRAYLLHESGAIVELR